MIDEYSYNDEPSGRVDTLAMALDKCERLEKQLSVAVEALKEYADGKVKKYGLAVRAYVAKVALKKIEELKK